MDCSPPGSSVHGISKARKLQWVAVSFPRVGGGQSIILNLSKGKNTPKKSVLVNISLQNMLSVVKVMCTVL